MSEQICTSQGRTQRVDAPRQRLARLVVIALPEARLGREVQLVVVGDQLTCGVEQQGAVDAPPAVRVDGDRAAVRDATLVAALEMLLDLLGAEK